MNREIDRDDRLEEGPRGGGARQKRGSGAGPTGDGSSASHHPNEDDQRQPAAPNGAGPRGRDLQPEQRHNGRPEPNQNRERAYQISQDARETMREIGRFRTLAVEDLTRQRYAGDGAKMLPDLRSLVAQGLAQRRTIWAGKHQGKIEFVALTRQGKRLLESEGKGTGQVFYDRFVKPAEILHDSAIYRMYQAEADRIEKDGGRVRRVVLDYELKQKAYSPLAKAKALPPLDYARRQEEIARENGLKVVQGHITLPDLRIEYETAQGEQTSVDLELATAHYHGSHLSSKAEAGFKMYATQGDASHLSRVLEEREITAEIFSL